MLMVSKVEISEAEFEIMEILWVRSPQTSKELLECLKKNWRLTTLNTLLGRLAKKGAVTYSKSGREYLYTPLVDRESYVKQESQNFLQKVFDGRLSPLVAHFSKHQPLEKNDIEALKKLIDEWENEHE